MGFLPWTEEGQIDDLPLIKKRRVEMPRGVYNRSVVKSTYGKGKKKKAAVKKIPGKKIEPKQYVVMKDHECFIAVYDEIDEELKREGWEADDVNVYELGQEFTLELKGIELTPVT